jgi:predicted outer membrane repeat protein
VVDSQFSDNKSFVVVARNIAIQRALFQNNPGVAIQSDGPGNITLEASLANGHIEVGLENALPCTLTIVDTKFERNRARVGGALLTGCDTAISGGKFINNTAFDGDGGAIYMTGTVPKLQLRRVKFENNTTNHGGGALKIPPNEMHSVVSLRFVTFTGNSAGRGGAIDLGEPGDQSLSATVSASVFKGNKARNEGGAIYAGGVALGLARVVFVDNTAQQGGAVALSPRVGGRTVIANSLFARNAAAHGSAVLGSLVDIVNSTIVGNTDGAALEAGYINAGERDAFSFANTIIADNSVGNCRASDTVTLRDNGHNLQHADGSCGGSIEVNDPVLDSLLVPSLGSPALNRGDDEICREPAVAKVDILGQKRPRGSHCTIGAYEGDIERFANLFWHDRIEHPHWPWER